MAEDARDREFIEQPVRSGAVRTLEVRVLDHHRAAAPGVVVRARLRRR
jgi:hypothetical protein